MKEVKVNFYDGLIYVDSNQCIMFPMNTFLIIVNKIIQNNSKTQVKEIFHNSSSIDAFIFSRENKNNNKKEILLKYLLLMKEYGFGEISLNHFSKKILLSQKKPFLSHFYSKLFKQSPDIYLEEIVFGFLKNILKYLFNKKIEGKLIIGKNVSYIFEIKDESITENDNFDFKYDYPKEKEATSILKKVLLNNHLQNTNGEVRLWGIPAIFIPLHFLINCTSKLEGDNYRFFFQNLGKIQGVCAVEIQRKKFGIISNDIFFEIVKQSNLIGMGRFIINKKKPLEFSISNNLDSFYSNFYPKENYLYIKEYLLYDIKGIYESIISWNTNLKFKNEFFYFEKNSEFNLSKEEKDINKYLNINSFNL